MSSQVNQDQIYPSLDNVAQSTDTNLNLNTQFNESNDALSNVPRSVLHSVPSAPLYVDSETQVNSSINEIPEENITEDPKKIFKSELNVTLKAPNIINQENQNKSSSSSRAYSKVTAKNHNNSKSKKTNELDPTQKISLFVAMTFLAIAYTAMLYEMSSIFICATICFYGLLLWISITHQPCAKSKNNTEELVPSTNIQNNILKASFFIGALSATVLIMEMTSVITLSSILLLPALVLNVVAPICIVSTILKSSNVEESDLKNSVAINNH